MTWRNPAPRYGHVEQFLVHLRGDRVVRLDRAFEKPPGYTTPERPVLAEVLQFAGVFILIPAALGAWAFGLFVLFKTRNWDALTARLPLAVCALLILQMGGTRLATRALCKGCWAQWRSRSFWPAPCSRP